MHDAAYWAQFDCADCGTNTSTPHGNSEYYVIHTDLWEQIGMTVNGGMLCIGCVESRLGRELTGDDFVNCCANLEPDVSERLRDRRTRGVPDDLRAVRTALKAIATVDPNLPYILAGVEQYLMQRDGELVKVSGDG